MAVHFLDQKLQVIASTSCVSLILVGDNSWVPILRKLTSVELFINAKFYSQHPLFSTIVEKHGEFHNSLTNL